MLWIKRCCFFLLLIMKSAFAIEVAITVDDLPYVGDYEKNPTTSKLQTVQRMLDVFKKHHLTEIYGFINGYRVDNEQSREILQLWVQSGPLLGNHTYSHMDLVSHSANTYIQDIQKNDPILIKFMGNKNYHYFRYPYLREGNTEAKREAVRDYLLNHHYQIAEVTMDFWDYLWNVPYERCLKQKNQNAIAYLKTSYLSSSVNAIQAARALSYVLFQRDIKYILLLHIGSFDAIMLDKVLTEYEKAGVHFISLPDALSDPVYAINADTVSDTGYTFLNEIRRSRHLPNPPTVTKFYDSIPEDKLSTLCVGD
jgi:peptidoglycan/xylan/chitin deacetylase (PgdA/CDA1 family)